MATVTFDVNLEPDHYPLRGGQIVTGRRVQAWLDGQVIGTFIFDDQGIFILADIDDQYQRMGIGTAMFYAAKEGGIKPRRGAKVISPAAKEWADTLDWS